MNENSTAGQAQMKPSSDTLALMNTPFAELTDSQKIDRLVTELREFRHIFSRLNTVEQRVTRLEKHTHADGKVVIDLWVSQRLALLCDGLLRPRSHRRRYGGVLGEDNAYTMKEDWERERTAALSEMFDNVDENGIYPTTKLYERLDKYVASLLTKRIEQAVAEERMRVREVCEDLKCSVDHSMDIQIDTRIYHDGYNQAIEHIAAALQDPRRGGESV